MLYKTKQVFYWLSSCADFNFSSAVLHSHFSFSLSVDMVFNSRFKMDVDSLMTYFILCGFWLRTINLGLLITDRRNLSTPYSVGCISAVSEKLSEIQLLLIPLMLADWYIHIPILSCPSCIKIKLFPQNLCLCLCKSWWIHRDVKLILIMIDREWNSVHTFSHRTFPESHSGLLLFTLASCNANSNSGDWFNSGSCDQLDEHQWEKIQILLNLTECLLNVYFLNKLLAVLQS